MFFVVVGASAVFLFGCCVRLFLPSFLVVVRALTGAGAVGSPKACCVFAGAGGAIMPCFVGVIGCCRRCLS